MLKYDDLEKSTDGMPVFHSLFPVLLYKGTQKSQWKRRELCRDVADLIGMPPSLRESVYPSGNGVVIEDRADWALSYLTTGGLFERVSRGVLRLTDLGHELYAKHGNAFDRTILKKLPKYIEHQTKLAERKLHDGKQISVATDLEDDGTLVGRMNQVFTDHRTEVAQKVLERILSEDSYFFERLVAKLLTAMGYQGVNGSAKVTKRSGDGGVDIIFNQDTLGINIIYVQVKQYKNQNIQRIDIDSFSSVVRRDGAKGVFVTTSGFSDGAKKAAKHDGITIIDGYQLTDLMLTHGVGVRVEQTYALYDLDDNFFDEI